MARTTMKCPNCATEGTLSLLDPDYDGPYACWKCHALFTVRIRNGEAKSWASLSREELQRCQTAEEMKRKRKPGPRERD